MRARARRRGHFALLAGLLSLIGPFARNASGQAPDAGSPAPDSTRTVDVTIVDGGDDADLLMDTIRELVGRLGLSIVPHRVTVSEAQSDTPPPRGLSAWVDLASRYEVMTVVRNGPTEVRRKVPRDASPAIVREEIGEAVRSAIESQLLADEAPSAPAPPPAPPPPPPTPAIVVPEGPPSALPSTHGVALDVTMVAGGGPVADGSGPIAHVGGGLVVASRRAWRPSLSVTAEYVVPFDSNAVDGVSAQATFVLLRAVAAIELVHRSWIALDVGAGGGVDVITVDASPTGMNPAIAINSDVPTRVDPILTARAVAYVALTPGVALTLLADGDVDFASRHYAITGAASGDVFVPWHLRPAVLAGFTFTALGSGLFAARGP